MYPSLCTVNYHNFNSRSTVDDTEITIFPAGSGPVTSQPQQGTKPDDSRIAPISPFLESDEYSAPPPAGHVIEADPTYATVESSKLLISPPTCTEEVVYANPKGFKNMQVYYYCVQVKCWVPWGFRNNTG